MRITGYSITSCLLVGAALILFTSFKAENVDCIKHVQSLYKQMLAQQPPTESKQVYYVNYTVRTVSQDSLNDGIAESNIEMWMAGKRMQLKSTEMEIYQDEDEVFTVLPRHKMLVRSDRLPNEDNSRGEQAAFFQDTLFALSTVSQCQTMGHQKRIIMDVGATGQQLYQIKQVRFDINLDREMIRQVRVSYTDSYRSSFPSMHNTAYMDYIVHELNYDYKERIKLPIVAGLFLDRNGRPKGAYADYELVDTRFEANKTIFEPYAK